LRSKAARWAEDSFDRLAVADPQVPEALNDRAADNWRPLLAIADLSGGEWPQLARQAALTLSGEAQEGAVDVELLREIRLAFGDDNVIRSIDLVAKLTADPKRSWAEWKHGRPLTQKQLASLLNPFRIISTTVHQLGLAHGKGYRRVDFEEAWAAYCPGQNTPSQQSDNFEACKRASADEMATTRDFPNGRENVAHGSKDANLFNSRPSLHGCTDRKDKDGAEGVLPLDLAAAGEDIPTVLRRCAHCHRPGAERWDLNGQAIWLHGGGCQEAWAERRQ
jgi:hypothetical protein